MPYVFLFFILHVHTNRVQSIKAIKDTWDNMNLTVEPHTVHGMYIVKASDEILQLLEEHIVQLYSMKGSKYARLDDH